MKDESKDLTLREHATIVACAAITTSPGPRCDICHGPATVECHISYCVPFHCDRGTCEQKAHESQLPRDVVDKMNADGNAHRELGAASSIRVLERFIRRNT